MESGPELPPVSVRVTQAWSGAAASAHPARVVPVHEADVATRMAGTLTAVTVEVGDRVAAGTVVARLDDADIRARVDGAAAQVELAERTFQRMSNLARDGAASQQELDEARARLEGARGQLAEARAQLDYAVIPAPLAGTVTARMADPGDLAAPGQPLLRIAGPGIKVVAELPGELQGRLDTGTEVVIEGTDGHPVRGTVLRAVPSLDPASRRFRVEVAPAEAAALLAGSAVRIVLPAGGDESRWIPADAVVRSGQLTGVYTVESDTLRLRWLSLGRTEGAGVEVLAGPAGALTVVREPAQDLRDGQPVSSVETVSGPGVHSGSAPSAGTATSATSVEG